MEDLPAEPRGPSGTPPPVGDPDAWKVGVLGQASRELIPSPPEQPETFDDELAREALADPAGITRDEMETSPTLWRVVVLFVVAIAALSVVFGLAR